MTPPARGPSGATSPVRAASEAFSGIASGAVADAPPATLSDTPPETWTLPR